MAHGPEYFPSKGACIYCGAQDRRLGDEHVVPYSLGGTHVIRKASCPQCENMTKKFEQKVARDLWGDARTAFNQPTRRKKERKTHIDLTPHGGENVPFDVYPAVFVFYKMAPCGYLQGLPESVDISSSWEFVAIDDEARRNAFFQQYGSYAPIQFRHVPDDFGRLLAKIAYCQILTALDPGDFRAVILPYIKGEKKNLSYLVGGIDTVPDDNLGYRLTTMYAEHDTGLILMVEIRLYANTHAPTYQVIVGDVVEPEAVKRVREKLDNA